MAGPSLAPGGGLSPRHMASNSAGGRPPRLSCSRLWLSRPRYFTTASRGVDRVRQMRSAISSVLKQFHEARGETRLLAQASPTDPTEASTPWSASVWV